MADPRCELCGDPTPTLLDGQCASCALVKGFSRLDVEIELWHIRHMHERYLETFRPHGRWRTRLPKENRINPRTIRKHYRTIVAMYEALYDALLHEAPTSRVHPEP